MNDRTAGFTSSTHTGGGALYPGPRAAPQSGPLPQEPARAQAGAGPQNGTTPHPANGGSPPPAPLPPLGADVRSALMMKAERIPLRALEKRGFRNVQVLDMATIEKIVAEAVTHTVERHTAILSREDRMQLEADARREFAKLLDEHKRVVAEKSDSDRARETLGRQVEGLRAELARQQEDLARELAGGLSLSPESFRELEERIRSLFATLVSKERRLSLAEAGPAALAGLNELEREVAAMLDRLLEDARGRLLGARAGSEKVDILEKRIAKLNKALADTEDALRRVSELKAGDPGIASIYESVQGLSPRDLFFQKKKELLEIIFKENLAIQGNVKVIHRKDVPVADEAAPVPALVVPPGFEPPLEPATEETAF